MTHRHKLVWGHSPEGGNNVGITNSNKLVNLDQIDCDGSLRVTLALTAAPDIITNPTDIVLYWTVRAA